MSHLLFHSMTKTSLHDRLEYEDKRDMKTPRDKLAASIKSLGEELEIIQQKEAEAKEAKDQAEILMNELREEVSGTVANLNFIIRSL